jgi:hypothetical protein
MSYYSVSGVVGRILINSFQLSIDCQGYFALESGSNIMQTFETTDALDARRCRYAQYGGQAKTLTLCGATISGMVADSGASRPPIPR